MLYEAVLSRGGAERPVPLELSVVLKKDDLIHYQLETYRVASVQPGHDEFDAVVFADLVGSVGPGQFLPP